jgi:hypothetical protein
MWTCSSHHWKVRRLVLAVGYAISNWVNEDDIQKDPLAARQIKPTVIKNKP